MKKIIFLALFAVILAAPVFAAKIKVTLWHGCRGDEKRALEKIAEMFNFAYMAVPMPNFPEMAMAWVPSQFALWDIIRGMRPEDAPTGTATASAISPG